MLIKCPECELQVSDKALSCPHCGNPLKSEVKNRGKIKVADADDCQMVLGRLLK